MEIVIAVYHLFQSDKISVNLSDRYNVTAKRNFKSAKLALKYVAELQEMGNRVSALSTDNMSWLIDMSGRGQ